MSDAKMKTCKACSTEVAKTAKTCPKCGAKLKVGFLPKLLIALVGLAILGVAAMPSKEEQQAALKEIQTAEISDLSPHGELAAIFNLMSKHTDLQRENKEKEITGKVVKWTLPVYEVSKRKDGVYQIQTRTTSDTVGTSISLHTRSDAEKGKVEALTTGDLVSIKGRISGVTLRHINIEYAIIDEK